MLDQVFKNKCKSVRFYLLLGVVFLLVSCGIVIVHPIDGTITKSGVTVYSEVKLNQNICGAPFRATLNGNDVTNKFAPLHPGNNPLWTNFYNLPPGPYSLVVNADMEQGFPSSCGNRSNSVNFKVEETPYMEVCRKGGVPLPPNWAETGTQWELQGNLRTGKNMFAPGEDAFIWAYSAPGIRGGCLAIGREGPRVGHPLFGVICQSASTGNACFWEITAPWKNQALAIASLEDGSVTNDRCPRCHRGNNVFLMAPDDPTWANVLRGALVTRPGSTFTTRVETSLDNQGGHPRYIPISGLTGPRPLWQNTFTAAVGCAGACHENPNMLINEFQNFPMPPLPACAMGSPASDPAKNCYG